MLALARKAGESIIVNDNIEVTVLEIKGDQIKIGINAPKSVPIYRKEIYDQIQEANADAANTVNPQALADLMGAKKK
jgi:carbon storage regulator